MRGAAVAALLGAASALAGPQPVQSFEAGEPKACAPDRLLSVQLQDGAVVADAVPPGARVDPLPFKVKWGAYPDDAPGVRIVHPVEDGFIVGYNAGALGGGIWWFSRNGSDRRFIAKEHPVTFLQRGGEVLALVGVTLEGRASGRLLRMYRLPDGTWRWDRVAELSRTPRTGLLEPDGSVLVLFDNSVLRVLPSGEKVPVHQGSFRAREVASMVKAPDGALYLGGKRGVVQLSPKGEGEGYAETFRAAPCP